VTWGGRPSGDAPDTARPAGWDGRLEDVNPGSAAGEGTARDLRRRHHVTETGDPAGRPIVFAHGYSTDQGVWRHVAPAFEEEFRVIRFDHAGCGRADPAAWDPRRHARIEGFADDVVALVEALDLRDAVLVGHSASAMIGALAVTMCPERFDRLVMVGASARYLDDEGYVGGFDREEIEGLLARAEADHGGWASGAAPRLAGEGAPPEVAEELETLLRRNDGARTIPIARSALLGDRRAEVERVPVPTLVVQTTHDPLVPLEASRYLERHLPDGHLVLLAATGHFPSLSAPSEVIAAIRAFL
jgi:sigma-B regulation protein RsbQ